MLGLPTPSALTATFPVPHQQIHAVRRARSSRYSQTTESRGSLLRPASVASDRCAPAARSSPTSLDPACNGDPEDGDAGLGGELGGRVRHPRRRSASPSDVASEASLINSRSCSSGLARITAWRLRTGSRTGNTEPSCLRPPPRSSASRNVHGCGTARLSPAGGFNACLAAPAVTALLWVGADAASSFSALHPYAGSAAVCA